MDAASELVAKLMPDNGAACCGKCASFVSSRVFGVWSLRSMTDWAMLTVSLLHTVVFAKKISAALGVSSVISPVPSGFSRPWYCWKTF